VKGGGLGASMMLERAHGCLVDDGKKKPGLWWVHTGWSDAVATAEASKQAAENGTRATHERRATHVRAASKLIFTVNISCSQSARPTPGRLIRVGSCAELHGWARVAQRQAANRSFMLLVKPLQLNAHCEHHTLHNRYKNAAALAGVNLVCKSTPN
jgi:hypothetical protein